MTREELRAWVVAGRRARKLPDQIEDPASLTRLARLVIRQRPGRLTPPTSSATAVDAEHPEARNADALRRGVLDPEGDDRGANPRVQEYAATRQ